MSSKGSCKKILVTGGAGYIGSHTVVELYIAGFEPIIVDNFSNSEQRAINGIEKVLGRKVTVYIGNCTDELFVREVIKSEGNICGVIHFAAYKAVGESVREPLKYYHNNLTSTLVIMKLMQEYNIQNLVFSSSCTVYGEPENLPVSEQSPRLEANSPYGNTKQICEDIISDQANSNEGRIKAISLRYFNPIGAHSTGFIGELPIGIPNNLVPFITQTGAGLRGQVTVFGSDYDTPDGTCIRDYIHVVDLANSHVKALDHLIDVTDKNHYDVVNVGTGRGNSVLEVIETFEQVSKIKLNYTIGPRREGDVEQVYGSVEKAEQVIGWKAQHSLKEAIEDAWRWQKTLSNK